MKLAIIVLSLISSLLSSPIQSSSIEIIGIPQSKKIHYDSSSKEFTCLDLSKKIPFSQVNDDFCDCPDASDEPGTSACPNGQFYCMNSAFRPKSIPTRFVNDGYCDCCDGSDEYKSPSGLLCENTCSEKGRSEMEKLKKYELIHQEGYKRKLEFIQLAIHKREEKENELTALREEIELASGDMTRAEHEKNKAEELANEAKEKHKEFVEAIKQETLKSKIQDVFNSLDTNHDGTVSEEELKIRPELDMNGDGSADETELMTVFGDVLGDGVSDEEFNSRWEEYQAANTAFTKRQDEMIRAIKGGDETRVPRPESENNNGEDEDTGIPPEDDYVSEGDSSDDIPPPTDSEAEDTNTEYDEETKALISTADDTKRVYEDAKRTHDDIQKKIDSIDKFLSLDLGNEHEYYPTSEKCFSKDDREYTYELCPFNKVIQRPKNGGRETSLGAWGHWEQTTFLYSSMLYEKGERCWNGPERNTQVLLLCGSESELISVDEPNRCQYMFEFRTPAACQATLAMSRLHRHDEL